MSVESLLFHPAVALQFSSKERAISQARLLSPNQIQEIVMDSDSNKKKYSTSEDTEDNEPRPPSPRSSISQPPSPDFSASSSEDEDDVGNVAGQQPQLCLRTPPRQPRRLFFHLLDLAIVNRYIVLSFQVVGRKFHRDFRLMLIREMLARSGHEPRPSIPVGRPAPASTNIRRLDTRHNKHWPGRNTKQRRCSLCSARGVTRTVVFKCIKCDAALCVDRSFFENYHTKKTYKTSFSSFSMETVGASIRI